MHRGKYNTILDAAKELREAMSEAALEYVFIGHGLDEERPEPAKGPGAWASDPLWAKLSQTGGRKA